MRTFPYNRIDQYFSLSASCVHACPGLNASIVCFSTSCLAGLFDIFILLAIFDTMVCVWVTLYPLRDAYHKQFESHQRSILDISAFIFFSSI